ncbi:hypothetical protein LXL04_023163 [Taraxacum kok-saghyz]
MDRSHWMYKPKRSDEKYLAGLGGFLKTAEENRLKKGESHIWCPCKDCENCQKKNCVIVEEHLIRLLQHMTIIAPYINENKRMLDMANRGRSKRWLIAEHNKTFSQWLKDKVKASYGLETMDQIVQHLGSGPEHLVTTYKGYDISDYTFYTNQQDHKSSVQNSGVTVIASTELSGDTIDARSRIAKESYYGVIKEIWE